MCFAICIYVFLHVAAEAVAKRPDSPGRMCCRMSRHVFGRLSVALSGFDSGGHLRAYSRWRSAGRLRLQVLRLVAQARNPMLYGMGRELAIFSEGRIVSMSMASMVR